MPNTQTRQRLPRTALRRPVVRRLHSVGAKIDTSRKVKSFYRALFFTTLLPYLTYVFPFMPRSMFGLNITGWAWSLMLVYVLLQFPNIRDITFPWKFWLPWTIYLGAYLCYDYSYLGLQLTCQYLLPIMIGLVASTFTYTDETMHWIFSRFLRLCLAVISMFVFGYLFRGGYTPSAAATPMLLSILAGIIVALYFSRDKIKYLVIFGMLFLIPFIDLTRMGIAVFIAIFVFHFANRKIKTKIWGTLIGSVLVFFVFNSASFQAKTFYEGYGSFDDLRLNYYEADSINSSGRSAWKWALEPGLEVSPVFGNGPRSDNDVLSAITGGRSGEAHNDYLSVIYNYGYVGLGLLLGGFILMFLKLKALLKVEQNAYRYLLVTTTMTLFIGFGMFMYTDNILKYTIFFPNLFFAMVGMSFAFHQKGKDNKNEKPSKQIVRRRTHQVFGSHSALQ